jgi:hypothetical protein
MAEATPRKVKIRTLVALSGADISLAAGDEWEVDEEVAEARIAAGLAEAIDPAPAPATERRTTKRAGKTVETTSTAPAEEREEP